VSLIGLGAIGAAYGSRLQAHLGKNFSVVVNEERKKRYKESGIHILGKEIDFHYETPDATSAPRDLVIFAVKNAELKQAIKEIKPHIGPDTIILSLLNGVSSEDVIYQETGNKHILPSMCVGIDAVREDRDIEFTSLGRITFGTMEEALQGDVEAVKALFSAASVPYDIPYNILHAIWAKFMFNVGINQVSAVLRAPYRYFQEIPSIHEWMEEAMQEVLRISQKNGVNLTQADIDMYRPILHSLSPDGKTSMLQDIESGRKTEVEYFAGEVVALGEKYAVPTPINRQLFQLITMMEEMNAYDTQFKTSANS
jgi:2-dehydropantoate 2-reductase